MKEKKNDWSNKIGELYKHENHKAPVTRRDFFAQSASAVTSFAIMPSLLNMIGARAYGQSLSCPSSSGLASAMMPVFVYDAAGGAAWMEDITAGGMGGQLDFIAGPGAYENFGIPDDLNYNAPGVTPDQTFGLAFHPEAAFLKGLKESLPAQYWNSVDGFLVANASNSDSANNYLATTHYFARYGRTGKIINVAGSNTTPGGGRHRPALNSILPETMPVRVDSPASARRIAGAGALVDLLSEDKARSVLGAIENMSRSKVAQFNNLTLDQQIEVMVNCGYIKTVDLPFQVSPNEIFPSPVPGGDNLNTAFDDANSRLAAMAKLVLDHNAGISVYQNGGYDNHNDTNVDPANKRFEAGKRIGQVIHYAALRGQPIYIIVSTDGAMGVRRQGGVVQIDNTPEQIDGEGNYISVGGRGMVRHPGDSDSMAGQFVLTYVPGASRGDLVVNANRQIGAYNKGGVIRTHLITADDTTRTAQVILYNYLALHGREDEIAKVNSNRDPFEGGAYLKLKKVI